MPSLPGAPTAEIRVGINGKDLVNVRVCEGGETAANQNFIQDTVSRWFGQASPPYMGGACGLKGACKGIFTLTTQALNLDDMGPEERKMTHATFPDLVVDLRMLPGCVEDMAMGNLARGKA